MAFVYISYKHSVHTDDAQAYSTFGMRCWETGQSYPDFQRLVLLSDYFDMALDELVKDIDVQDVRDKNSTDEKVASIYLDVENVKNRCRKFIKAFCYAGAVLLGVFILGYILHLFFPDIEWLWRMTQ